MTPRPRSPRPDDAALLRFISGESPLAESQAIEEWLAAAPDRAASLYELRAAWSTPDRRDAHFEKAKVWHRIATQTRRPSQRQPWRAVPFLAATAAALVLVITLTLDRATEPAVQYRDVVTPRGQQAVLDLSDGSRVFLAPESRLRIPSNFAAEKRELQLEGRAHFVVTHDSTKPFLVRTATAIAEDLGTAFSVSSYAESPQTEIIVSDGAVALRVPASEKRLLTLTRGDRATLDSIGIATLTRNVDVDRLLSWTSGILTIDNTPLRDAIADLERWYDVEIQVSGDPTLLDRRLTAQLRSEPPSRAAERLALILDARAELTDRVITLSRRP